MQKMLEFYQQNQLINIYDKTSNSVKNISTI